MRKYFITRQFGIFQIIGLTCLLTLIPCDAGDLDRYKLTSDALPRGIQFIPMNRMRTAPEFIKSNPLLITDQAALRQYCEVYLGDAAESKKLRSVYMAILNLGGVYIHELEDEADAESVKKKLGSMYKGIVEADFIEHGNLLFLVWAIEERELIEELKAIIQARIQKAQKAQKAPTTDK